MEDVNNLLLLFDRPQEPIFMSKGDGTVFDVPAEFLTERYRPLGGELQNRFGEQATNRITVKSITIPDLTIPMTLGRHEHFSLFIPRHRKIAGRFIDLLMGVRAEDLQSVALYARDRVNPYLFNYALSVALLHRPETKHLNLPSFFQSFPDKYVDSKTFGQIREEAVVVPEGSRMPIIIPTDYTASNLDPEHRLWYFREDIGINLHHWHWHLVYPFEASNREIVDKDRRGELFYYMHQQIIARYNAERFSNNLKRVEPYKDFNSPIKEGYFPKMDSLVASRSWPPRTDNTVIRDLKRDLDEVNQDVTDLERWRARFLDAIAQDFVLDASNSRIPLDETRGIDILGNMMESSIISPNRDFYGDLHNMGHVFISYAHDPDHRHLESFGVMGESSTAMRDPVFYRWHSHIDDIFNIHKERLTPYTSDQLNFDGVSLTSIFLNDPNVVKKRDAVTANTFETFWQQSDVNLSRGLDFVPRGNVFVRFTHLQHMPFTYTIKVNNTSGAKRSGIIRIFMAPKRDERRMEMLLRHQRRFMIELDKFIVEVHPGSNTYNRRSSESTVTIPFERTFRNLDINRPAANTAAESEFNFCGCGWPDHMLIPKGRPEGLHFDLFAMITNYDIDKVDQSLVGSCNDAASYCGIRDRLYPDKRPMGFPFDRRPRNGIDTLQQFLTPNMATQNVKIIHNDRTRLRI